MKNTLSEIYNELEALLGSENPFQLYKDRIEWIAESTFNIMKIGKRGIVIKTPGSLWGKISVSEAAGKLALFYRNNKPLDC